MQPARHEREEDGRDIYNKKKNINGKREANEKETKKTCGGLRGAWRDVGKCERSSWHPSNRDVNGERDGCMSCITRGVRCIQRIRMHRARKEMANGGFGDHAEKGVGVGIGCERRQ